MTPAQLRMLKALERFGYCGKMKHGAEGEWFEASEIVMDQAACYGDGLAWRRADRTFGALLRLGMIEQSTTYSDLVRVSDRGLEALGVSR